MIESRESIKVDGRCLVLGATGWLGTQIVDRLRRDGCSVLALSSAQVRDAFEQQRGGSLGALTSRDVVINSMPSRVSSDLAQDLDEDLSLVQELCIQAAVRGARMIHVGSAAEYAPSTKPLRETANIMPVSAYGAKKAICSAAVLTANEEEGLDACVVRPFTLSGPSPHRGMLINDLLRRIRAAKEEGGALWLDDVECRRDLVGSDMVARCISSLVSHQGDLPRVLNICSGRSWTIGGMAQELLRRMGLEISIGSRDILGQPRSVVGDPQLMRELFALEEARSLRKLMGLSLRPLENVGIG